jgi:hypothetical protein
MDQVVDRAIEREHALMELLKTRTPLVENYLQNLKFDPQVGPTAVQDHYFLGRMGSGRERGPPGLSLNTQGRAKHPRYSKNCERVCRANWKFHRSDARCSLCRPVGSTVRSLSTSVTCLAS